jgi:hypothetical protein
MNSLNKSRISDYWEKVLYIILFFGGIIFIYSWMNSYPVSFESPYLFIFNNFSPYYWISLPIITGSIYLLINSSINENLKWFLSVLTFIIIYSSAFFHYIVPSSDANSFLGLTDNLLKTGDMSTSEVKSYYQWPLFFILNSITINVLNIDISTSTHIVYLVISLIISSGIYIYSKNHGEEGYFSIISFLIILYYFINYQWAPYTVSIIPLFLIIYLDDKITTFDGGIVNILIFLSLCYYHLITPLLIIIYYFFVFILTRNRKYINLFLLTFLIYILIQSYGVNFELYVQKITEIYLFEIQRTIGQTQVITSTERPIIDQLAQNISRIIIPLTSIFTVVGLFFVYRQKKLKYRDYALLLTGMIFSPTLLLSFQSYPSIFWRAIPVSFLPISLGASALTKKYSKVIKPIFLAFVILFTFVLIHDSMYDRQVFVVTENEYKEANFLLDNLNYKRRNKILSHFRFMTYLRVREGDRLALFYDTSESIENVDYYSYIIYSIGLGKTYLQNGYTIEESYQKLEQSNIIFSSGKFYNIYYNK